MVKSKDTQGFTTPGMLDYLSKQSGGIPDFAKKMLVEKGGVDKKVVEQADKAGKATKKLSST